MTFDDYINEVDSHVILMTDLTLDDLPDTADLHHLYESGFTAHRAAREILRQNNWKG